MKIKLTRNILTAALSGLLIGPSISSVLGQETRQLVGEDGKVSKKRTALVIGNGQYQRVPPLNNPVNDATDMAAVLQGVGFEVIKGTDTNRVQMHQLIRRFGEMLARQGGIGLFYYAGHGVEVQGKNFLIPIDADIAHEAETEDYAVDLNSILRQMDAAGNGFNVVILDACRNNPFARGWSRSVNAGGLANVLAPTGTYIAFSAAPGSTASDGQGLRNGTFTSALLKHIRRPNLKLEEVFKATRAEVMTLTTNKQVPWDSSSIKGDFYFVRSTATETGPPTIRETVVAKDVTVIEDEAWSYIKNSEKAEDFREFLKDFPSGLYSNAAKIKLEQAVWDAAKGSNDRARLIAYLNEFPSGANAPLARIRLRQLEGSIVNPPLAFGDKQASTGGRVWICKTVDDDWNCVGESTEWQANKGFDLLFKNPTPVGVDFIGIVFHRQGPDGKDVEFINEYQQKIGEKNRFYATMNNELRLPPGTFSVYVIPWGKRQVVAHNGNLKEYFAKMTLTVK